MQEEVIGIEKLTFLLKTCVFLLKSILCVKEQDDVKFL